MEPYGFGQDFFVSYRASPDAIKALWLIVPPTFAVGLAWVLLNAGKTSGGRQNKTGEASQPAGQFPGPSGGA
jgi:hypothetical protein